MRECCFFQQIGALPFLLFFVSLHLHVRIYKVCTEDACSHVSISFIFARIPFSFFFYLLVYRTELSPVFACYLLSSFVFCNCVISSTVASVACRGCDCNRNVLKWRSS